MVDSPRPERRLPRPTAAARRAGAALAALVVAACLALPPAPATAQSLDAARAQGLVGERYDGLVVVRQPGAPPAVRQLVQRVNRDRSRIYARRAAEQKVPSEQVGRLYAREIVAKAPKGTWFLLENGQWRQK